LINERASISTEMAIRLEKGLGSSADAWLRMQAAYDLAQARDYADEIRVRRLERA
jgi:addiction module HigA family antidote